MRNLAWPTVGLLAAVISFSPPASATSITLQSGPATGLTTNTATAGTSVAPYTVNFNVTSITPSVFLNFAGGLTNPSTVSGGFTAGDWIQVTLTNLTGLAWTSVQYELEVSLGVASPNGDGLSFGQNSGNLASSNVYPTVTQIDTSKDYRNFHGATVANGSSATFLLPVTDNLAHNLFYLAVTENVADVATPEPTTSFLIGGGLVALAMLRQRRKINGGRST